MDPPDTRRRDDRGRRGQGRGLLERLLGFDGTITLIALIALIAHAHLLRILGARWLDLDGAEGRRFTLDTATISILGWERENRVIRRSNDPCGWR